nr:MAG TPA: hypothetical protein [Caudoviricetes sp.]
MIFRVAILLLLSRPTNAKGLRRGDRTCIGIRPHLIGSNSVSDTVQSFHQIKHIFQPPLQTHKSRQRVFQIGNPIFQRGSVVLAGVLRTVSPPVRKGRGDGLDGFLTHTIIRQRERHLVVGVGGVGDLFTLSCTLALDGSFRDVVMQSNHHRTVRQRGKHNLCGLVARHCIV